MKYILVNEMNKKFTGTKIWYHEISSNERKNYFVSTSITNKHKGFDAKTALLTLLTLFSNCSCISEDLKVMKQAGDIFGIKTQDTSQSEGYKMIARKLSDMANKKYGNTEIYNNLLEELMP